MAAQAKIPSSSIQREQEGLLKCTQRSHTHPFMKSEIKAAHTGYHVCSLALQSVCVCVCASEQRVKNKRDADLKGLSMLRIFNEDFWVACVE